jgi:hypothetical protein
MEDVMNNHAKEARLRREARRQGYMLKKSRRRNPEALDYGRFWLIDPYINGLVTSEYGLDLDEVEEWLVEV